MDYVPTAVEVRLNRELEVTQAMSSCYLDMYNELQAKYEELQKCYECALLDLEHTRKELLRANS